MQAAPLTLEGTGQQFELTNQFFEQNSAQITAKWNAISRQGENLTQFNKQTTSENPT